MSDCSPTSEQQLCGQCQLPVHPDDPVRHCGDYVTHTHSRCVSLLRAEISRLDALINTPHTHDFIDAVRLEMPHQRERWGAAHDAGKTSADWFWLVGYLAGKALHALVSGNAEKAKHHVITTAAALGNWFLAITGESTSMRPGIDPPKEVTDA